MVKSRIQKKRTEIELLLNQFDRRTADSEKKLQKILETVIAGTAPEEKHVEELRKSMAGLRETYNKICAIARDQLSESELPPEGSPAKDFVTAVNEKRAKELEALRKEALDVFKRFAMVWSDDKYYLRMLSKHKQAFSEYVRILENPELSDSRFTETEEYRQIMIPAKTFLKALDCEDPDSEEGIELLDKVSQYFSLDIAVGIMKKQYYIMKYRWE